MQWTGLALYVEQFLINLMKFRWIYMSDFGLVLAFIRVSRQFITHTKFDENQTSHLTDVERSERTDRKTEFSSLFCFRLAHQVQSKFAFALSYNKSGRMDTVP
jgi:GR25 family glycosyltransferase involved in LPS biosynthesis